MPHTALAADSENSKSWTGKYNDTVTLSRLAGENADETAAAISQEGFTSSKCAIIARWDDFADALGASGLAGTLDCPILLTRLDKLSQATIDELERLGTDTVYVVGGTGAISEQIDADLDNIPTVKTHKRIWGEYAWDTSLECAKAITEHDGNKQSEVIVTTSFNFQDALSISPYAYKYKVPLILETDSAQLTSDAISFINTTTGTIYVPGGNGAVPEKSVEGVFTDRVSNIVRLWGDDGYDTSNQIATYMTENNNLLSVDTVAIASGAQKAHGVDALAGAALVGKQGGVMLLANGNSLMEGESYTTIDAGNDSQNAPSFLRANQYEVKDAYVLGGTVVVPTAFFDKVEKVLRWTPSPDPDPDPDPEIHALPNEGWALSADTLTYNGTAQTPAITAPNNLKEGTDYTVTYTNNKDAGIASVTITGKGAYEGTVPLTFTISPKTLSVSFDTTTFTYNGSEQAPTPKLDGVCEGDTVTCTVQGAQTNAGTYTATLSIANANYTLAESDKSVEFTIEKATPDAPTGLTTTAQVNQTLAYVALPTLPEGFDGKLSWKNSEETTGTEITTITATAIYTPKDTVNYLPVEVNVTITVKTDNVFTIVYHGNGTMLDGSDTYTQECEVGTTGTLDANKFTAPDGKTFAFWTLGAETSGGITAKSTKTCIDEHAFAASGDGIIGSPSKGDKIHLYAYWLDEDAGSYWMESANATNPGQTVDATNGQKSIDTNKSDTTFWNGFYNNTSTESHLYTIWQEDTVQVFANRFVEFRIIQVGAHDGDGSTVTFMATHSLPTAQRMFSTNTNTGGWAATYMRNTVFASDGYVQTGLSGLASAAKTVNKVATSGRYGSWVEDSTTQDKFWLMSFSELAGKGTNPISWGYFKNEGSQYDWCKENVTNPGGTNTAIEGMDKTRDGSSNPVGYNGSGWWLRSPRLDFNDSFGCVSTNGLPYNCDDANKYLGVAPAFAM